MSAVAAGSNPTALELSDLFSPFSQWVNDQRNGELNPAKHKFCFSDIDGVVISLVQSGGKNVARWMVLETKQGGANRLRPSQRPVMSLLRGLGSASHGRTMELDAIRADLPRRIYKLEFWGAHLLSMSHSSPQDSTRLLWNGALITLQQLIEAIRLERLP